MLRGVIFDLDGVLVSTDELHYQSWRQITAAEGIPFDRTINERLRGLGRPESLEIVLERAPRQYSPAEKAALAERKNDIYRGHLLRLGPENLSPGARELLVELRRRGIRTAIGSSSRNAGLIADRLAIRGLVDLLVDGNDDVRSKPEPDVFLLAARRLGLSPAECVVVEDAQAGVESARRAGMAVFGIGTPDRLPGVVRVAPDLSGVTVDDLLACQPPGPP